MKKITSLLIFLLATVSFANVRGYIVPSGLIISDIVVSGDITADNFIGDLTGQADTVATITGLAPDTATTQAAQPNITSVGTLTSLTVSGEGNIGGVLNVGVGSDEMFISGKTGVHAYLLTQAGSAVNDLLLGTFTDVPVVAYSNNAEVFRWTKTGIAMNSLALSGATTGAFSSTLATSGGNGGFGIATPASLDTAKIGSTHRFLDVAGATGKYAVIQAKSDNNADTNRIGLLTFGATAQDTSHKYVGWIETVLDGSTAGQRGGKMNFSVKSDGGTTPATSIIIHENRDVEIPGGDLTIANQHGCRVYINTTDTYTTNVSTIVTWDAESFDVGSMHVAGSTDVVIPSDGRYLITVHSEWTGNATGFREITVWEGSTNIMHHIVSIGSSVNGDAQQVTDIQELSESDVITVKFRQNSGGDLATISASEKTWFSVVKLN